MPTGRAASSSSRLAGSALAAPLCRVAGVLRRPLLRASLPPELLLNGLHDEVHEGDVVGHAVELQATVKLFRDAGCQLRPDFLGHRHQAAFFFDPAGRPGPRRRLRRRTVFAFGAAGVTTAAFFLCAIFSATAFGGRPGPPGRHVPRPLRRRRRRPFFGFGFVPETLPSNEWMADPTSSCTNSRMTVSKLPCLGIDRLLRAQTLITAHHRQEAAAASSDGRSRRRVLVRSAQYPYIRLARSCHREEDISMHSGRP